MTEKNKGGRPTKYSEDMLKKSQEYIASCIDDVDRVVESKNPKTGRERYIWRFEVNMPTAEGLAKYLEVHRSTLYEWAGKHKEFSDILEAINQTQVERLINRGLSGDYNPTIAKLVLAKHGYKESSEVEHSGGVKLYTWGEDGKSDNIQPEEVGDSISPEQEEVESGGGSQKSG